LLQYWIGYSFNLESLLYYPEVKSGFTHVIFWSSFKADNGFAFDETNITFVAFGLFIFFLGGACKANGRVSVFDYRPPD